MEEVKTDGGLLISGTAADGFLRMIGAETTAVVNEAQETSHTSPTATGCFGTRAYGYDPDVERTEKRCRQADRTGQRQRTGRGESPPLPVSLRPARQAI